MKKRKQSSRRSASDGRTGKEGWRTEVDLNRSTYSCVHVFGAMGSVRVIRGI